MLEYLRDNSGGFKCTHKIHYRSSVEYHRTSCAGMAIVPKHPEGCQWKTEPALRSILLSEGGSTRTRRGRQAPRRGRARAPPQSASLYPTTPSGPGCYTGTMGKAKKIKALEEDPKTKKHFGHSVGFGCLHLFPRGPCNVFECFPWSLPLPPAFCLPSPPKDHRLRACCYLEPCAPRPPQSEQRANSQGGRAAKCSPMLHLLRFCPRQERRKSRDARQRTSLSEFRK